MKLRFTLLFVLAWLCLVATAVPANAVNIVPLSSNGPPNEYRYAWAIQFGYTVSDTFTVPSGATITSFNFAVWVGLTDTPLTVDWSMTSSEFGGTTYASGSSNLLGYQLLSNNGTTHDANLNGTAFSVWDVSVTGLNISLGAGTYWLNLQNATTAQGGFIGWDENFGPASASESALGTIPSEDPDFYGYVNGTGSTPEPSSVLLFGSGILALGGAARHKLRF